MISVQETLDDLRADRTPAGRPCLYCEGRATKTVVWLKDKDQKPARIRVPWCGCDLMEALRRFWPCPHRVVEGVDYEVQENVGDHPFGAGRLRCCQKGNREIRHRKASVLDGPDLPGWSININDGGDPVFENIAYCPWCGRKLPPSE